MEGRKLYRYTLGHVAEAMKASLDRAGVHLKSVSKILIHHANWKMDEAIVDALYKSFGMAHPDPGVMPMTIAWLGNSSVATIPTILDLILKGKLEGHAIQPGEIVLLASVGAGMNINAVVYKAPAQATPTPAGQQGSPKHTGVGAEETRTEGQVVPRSFSGVEQPVPGSLIQGSLLRTQVKGRGCRGPWPLRGDLRRRGDWNPDSLPARL